MSEESSSTPLRLKPKLKADPERAAAIPGGEPPAAPAAGGDEASGGRLKLKPRSLAAATPPAAGVPPPPADVSTSAEPKVRLKPRLTPKEEQEVARESPPPPFLPEPSSAAAVPPPAIVPPVISDAPAPAVVGGFKLKPKSVADEPPPLPPAPSPASVIAGPSAGAPSEAGSESAPKMRVKPPPELVASFTGGTMPGLPPAPVRGRRPVLTLLLVVVLLGGGGYYGYYGYTKFIAPAPSSESVPPEATPPAAPTSLPGRMVSKAQDAVAAQDHRIDDLDEVQRDPAAKAPAAENESTVMAAMPARVEPPAPPAPEPSEAFTRFVTDMRISGVFQGDPPRALVNGRTVRAGETIDLGLGIVFVGIDADRRLILMREPSGALAAKKY